MREFDAGRPGDTLGSAWIVFVPRLLWSEKPVGIGPGARFYKLATGRDGTFLGLSVYGDAYWNFGWTGVIVLCSLMGGMIGLTSRLALYWLESRQVIYLPLIGLSMLSALLGPTKFFINGILAMIPLYLAYLGLIKLLEIHVRSISPTRMYS